MASFLACEPTCISNRVQVNYKLKAEFKFLVFNFASLLIFTEFTPSLSIYFQAEDKFKTQLTFSSSSSNPATFVFRIQIVRVRSPASSTQLVYFEITYGYKQFLTKKEDSACSCNLYYQHIKIQIFRKTKFKRTIIINRLSNTPASSGGHVTFKKKLLA